MHWLNSSDSDLGKAGRTFHLALVALCVGCGSDGQLIPPGTDVPRIVGPDSLFVGDTAAFSLEGEPGARTWTTSDPTVAVIHAATGVARGMAPGSVTLRAEYGGGQVSHALAVEAAPVLSVETDSVFVTRLVGSGPLELPPLNVVNAGGGHITDVQVDRIEYSGGGGTGGSEGWLAASLDRTVTPAGLSLSVLGEPGRGDFLAVVTLVSAARADTAWVRVYLDVDAPAMIALSRSAVSDTVFPGLVKLDSILVTNEGDVPLKNLRIKLSAADGGSATGVTATLIGTSAPATIRLRFDPETVDPPNRAFSLTVVTAEGDVEPRTIPIDLTVVDRPVIAVDAPSVTFRGVFGQEVPAQKLVVTNAGGWTFEALGSNVEEASSDWVSLQVDEEDGRTVVRLAPSGVTVGPGTHQAVLVIDDPRAATVRVPLFFHQDPPPVVGTEFLPTDCDSQVAVPGPGVASFSIGILNRGGGTLTDLRAEIVGDDPPWLDIGWDNGTTAPVQLRRTYDTRGLAVGDYQAVVRVWSELPYTNEIFCTLKLTRMP